MFGAARSALGSVKLPRAMRFFARAPPLSRSRVRLPRSSHRPDVRARSARRPRPSRVHVLLGRHPGIRHLRRRLPGFGSGAFTDASAPRVSVPKLVALLLDLNVEGQGIIRDVVARGDLGTRDKGGRDDVTGEYVVDAQTEADRRVEAHVLRALRAFCPALPVVAEESYENAAGDPSSADHAAEPYPVAPFAPEGEVIPRTPQARLALGSTLDWPPHLREPVDPARVVVFVDPLDGTNEFASGRREPVTC